MTTRTFLGLLMLAWVAALAGCVTRLSTDGGLRCGAGQTVCNELCVDTLTSREHCGACGTACAAGQVCAMGACAVSCGAGQTRCGSTCVSTATDNANCGACGMACPAGQVCSMGACGSTCTGGTMTCGEGASRTCANLQTDRAHCGACGNACPAGATCNAGRCETSCPPGQMACGGADGGAAACANLQTDRANCGACGTACAAGQICAAGRCELSCAANSMMCAGVCANLQTDRANCGACGTACPAGQVCNAGRCELSCAAGQTVCSNACTNLQTDRANCGACGTACPAGQVCSMGACAASCGAPLTLCSGACRDTRNDPTACGGCGTTCPGATGANAVCAAGTCAFVCSAGRGDCNANAADGCEVDLRADPRHCSACGRACAVPAGAAASTCVAGACGFTCLAGRADCDRNAANGCEVDTQADEAHCGACGNACPSGQLCVSGACRVGLLGSGTPTDPYRSTPLRTTCRQYLTDFPASARDGFYRVSPAGVPIDVFCLQTVRSGGWTRCTRVANGPGEDITNNSWLDPCVDYSNNALGAGGEVYVRLLDAAGMTLYQGSGPRGAMWTYDQLTSTTTPENQYHSMNHNRLVTLDGSDRLMIAGRNSSNSGCGGSMGNGYGITIYPNAPNYYFNPKMFVMSFRHFQTSQMGIQRSFSGWTAAHEITYTPSTYNSCSAVGPAINGAFEFYVR